jgi:hypothetical protein
MPLYIAVDDKVPGRTSALIRGWKDPMLEDALMQIRLHPTCPCPMHAILSGVAYRTFRVIAVLGPVEVVQCFAMSRRCVTTVIPTMVGRCLMFWGLDRQDNQAIIGHPR